MAGAIFFETPVWYTHLPGYMKALIFVFIGLHFTALIAIIWFTATNKELKKAAFTGKAKLR